MMFHVIARIAWTGNPRFAWTYREESLNGVVIKMAKAAHRANFMQTVHNRFRWVDKLSLSTHMF
jgi:hypothetical protein